MTEPRLRGAREAVFRRFRGLNLELDPTEIPDELGASGTVNVDFEGETLQTRGGISAYNAAAVGGGAEIQGIGVYYPRAGGRTILLACNGSVFADRNNDGDFADANETLVAALPTTYPYDFWQFREKMYFGSRSSSVYTWDGSAAAASLVAPITAPAAAPTLAVSSVQADHFDSGAWTASGGLATAYVNTNHKQGTNCLEVTADAAGDQASFIYRAWSAGATVDLSEVQEIVLWVQGNLPGSQFQVGVYIDGAALASGPTWGDFPVFKIDEANVWKEIRVPLHAIKPSDRDASPGVAIRYVSDGGRGYTTAHKLYFDDARIQGGMTPDRYAYYYTYADTDGSGNVLRESAPSPVAYIDLAHDAPYKGVDITPTASGDGTVDQIRIYRRRDEGFWSGEKMVKTRSNASTLVTDVRDDGAIDLDPLAVNLKHYRDAPPLAGTYTMVGNRLWCGHITAGGTTYPNRVYVSAFNDPEAFSPSEHVNVFDPNAAGWFDLPLGETIRRILDVDGMALIFTDRAIWTVEGDGWDNFVRRPRANVGLDARWAVVATDRLHYFLSRDGVRVLSANRGYAGQFPTWVISEPVASTVRDISTSYRPSACMGVDERGRVHLCFVTLSGASGQAVVFDPRQQGALAEGEFPLRPGWTYYKRWGWSTLHTLRRDSTDSGQMIGGYAAGPAAIEAGSKAAGKLYYIQRDATNTFVVDTDPPAAQWFSSGIDRGPGGRLEGVHITLTFNSRTGQTISSRVMLDLTSLPTYSTFTSTAASGVENQTVRLPATTVGRIMQVMLDMSTYSDYQYTVRNISLGYYVRR